MLLIGFFGIIALQKLVLVCFNLVLFLAFFIENIAMKEQFCHDKICKIDPMSPALKLKFVLSL